MSSNPYPNPSLGTATPGLGGIIIRFKQGRTVYSATDVKRVCDHYISIAGSGNEVTIHVLQFLRTVCLPFASPDALARLKTLPPPAIRPTLDAHFNVLLADDAPARLQTEFNNQPQSLFFVGNVADSAYLQRLVSPSPTKCAVRISRSFSQSALAVLMRYEEGTAYFPQQDIQTLLSYMKELNARESDVWLSLVAFLRDAARPYASAGLRRELSASQIPDEELRIIDQYNALVLHGALEKLVEAVHTRPTSSFDVEAGRFKESIERADRHGDQLHEAGKGHIFENIDPGLDLEMTGELFDAGDDEADDEADDETHDKENVDPKERRPLSSRMSSSVAHKEDSDGFTRVRFIGEVGDAGNALPSLIKARHHERDTWLSPRGIRDLVRQYDGNNPQTRQNLVEQKEVFYVGGKKKYQIRPEYFWVLVQPVEEDEPPITEAQMTAICPHWQYLQEVPDEEVQEKVRPLARARHITLEKIANKLDALRDEVAALTSMNKELRQEIKELKESSRSKPRNGVSSFSLSSSKKRGFDSDSGDTDNVDTPTKKFGSMKLQKRID